MKFEDLRKEYLKNTTTGNPDWVAVENNLGPQKQNLQPVLHKCLITTVILVLAVMSTVLTAQKSQPGSALYSVKVLSDNAYSKITGNYEAAIEKRTQDVIKSQDSPQQLEEATQQYSKIIEDSKQQADQKGEGNQFNQTLQRQEKEFEHAQENNPQNQKKLDEVIKHTKQISGDVEGDKDQNRDEKNRSNAGNGNKENQKKGD